MEPDAVPAVRDLARAAAVAKCRVSGDDALRLELAAAARAGEVGDDRLEARALARAVELLNRFPGMFAHLPAPAPSPSSRSRRAGSAGTTPGGRDPGRRRRRLRRGGGTPRRRGRGRPRRRPSIGDAVLESSALDSMIGAALAEGDVVGAPTCWRNVVWRPSHPGVRTRPRGSSSRTPCTSPPSARSAPATCGTPARRAWPAGAAVPASPPRPGGRRARRARCAVRQPRRRDRDGPRASSRTGTRPAGPWPPDAASPRPPSRSRMACAATGGPATSGSVCWRRSAGWPRPDSNRNSGYGELFEALVRLHDNEPSAAVDGARGGGQRQLYAWVFRQWIAAVRAEAAVLARSARRRCSRRGRDARSRPGTRSPRGSRHAPPHSARARRALRAWRWRKRSIALGRRTRPSGLGCSPGAAASARPRQHPADVDDPVVIPPSG